MVQDNRKVTRIAFAFPEDERWTGGVNYLHNLLFALASVEEHDLEPVLFAGDQVNEDLLERFNGLARIERSPLFNRFSFSWKARRAIGRLTSIDFLVRNLFIRREIDVSSHCNLASKKLPFRTINWIFDFQHMHLPELFPESELKRRNRKFRQWIVHSDCMILSSQDALVDYKRFAPGYEDKARVLPFVSQVNPRIYEFSDCHQICQKFNLPKKFFFLPNQFWAHKNHMTVVKAVGLLKSRGIKIQVVCSGFATDLKNLEYDQNLKGLIAAQGVAKQIHILGMIDYSDVLTLFRHAISVLNPSFFEGWSSTVEEAKSIGKNIILSDIAVHREQAPPEGCYFAPHDPEALAEVLAKKWQTCNGGPDFDLEKSAQRQLPMRTREFGEAYRKIVFETLERAI